MTTRAGGDNKGSNDEGGRQQQGRVATTMVGGDNEGRR
jgi:hypothetical protein